MRTSAELPRLTITIYTKGNAATKICKTRCIHEGHVKVGRVYATIEDSVACVEMTAADEVGE